ncbi:Urea amidolyase related protein [Alloalcanivorax dieselolei B5]|uniref:Biotin carboxylase n=1 Tax=Alcanivorax dieselolei (strain DSM 16502 / CGMCC 1.3690 / MCCC 1A00001 / B-5) TaxID=930169 RepID=K0CCZ8_ALCDB|nr:urea carboxylase [Alloalcanivorax dieselolei]AFT69446.1 Urea amidolyase related protein [Alloalcanivorax dieselolei B5]GGJ92823.1 urea carboxylase [Alloalcanivorax dieselolei]
MFKKVLIANRGAIATRIIRTLKTLGVTSVAVYADADADSRHVSLADEAYCLGDGSAASTYLDQDKLLALMAEHQIDAVHPGYGFLSENPDFVERCEAQGIAFIGPTPQQMRDFGLKHTARQLAEDNQVPLLPGTGLLTDPEQALAAANHIGYPVMLKSTAGGGGIGMQICHDAESLRKAWDTVRRLSANNFSNDGVFLEKYIERARHIEVQVFGDGKGQAVTLGERDCSAQRRHQKVVEETPAPNLPEDVRHTLHDTARRLMSAVHYRNAGTVEFILDQDSNRFYFLEVNTRLQVEHGVTEQVYGVDLVSWMVRLAAGELPPLERLAGDLAPRGHSIQVRLYAEDPNKDFQPSAGLLTTVRFPEADGRRLRLDHWIEAGLTVSPLYDPMLAKVIVHENDRERALAALEHALGDTLVEGIETNRQYVLAILADPAFREGRMTTRYLNDFRYQPDTLDVLAGGTLTTVQDYPGRGGYWPVGVPPSGPFDNLSFRLGNRLLGNDNNAAGLECTLNGPTLRFNRDTRIALTGADMGATLDGKPVPRYQAVTVVAGQTLKLGKVNGTGARAYIAVDGGIQCEPYLGSRSTFTLGQFGGHGGRALRTGDVLHLSPHSAAPQAVVEVPQTLMPKLRDTWTLRVIYGPHGAPDFFTDNDIATFFTSDWQVHYNSSRTGVRLVGPKPEWARSDGGEAGMHPSNIHDNAYAVGTIDFTGDMPVILGPDGPSLGGFVCPATVIKADLWKLGQLKAGDKVRFQPVSLEDADRLCEEQDRCLQHLDAPELAVKPAAVITPVLDRLPEEEAGVEVVYRAAGDRYVLVEYGPLELDLRLRFRAHALMLWLEQQRIDGVLELTPGIRSLQIHFDPRQLPRNTLLTLLKEAELSLQQQDDLQVPSRIVHLPLSWDDEACRLAIWKYMQSVRKDAPWCPSNIEFIRRINGLDSIDEVKRILFEASYVVMGLGDVYLGAPVATPYDPRHRLVTTKYNPARTWTAENSVGIGGSYLCVYGMEGPGGYQFVGRTLQMWNRYRTTEAFTKPWLLRFFDQIRFYEVSAGELQQIRRDFPKGDYPLKVEETTFSLNAYQDFLQRNDDSIRAFTGKRNRAFDEELQRWVESGQIHFESQQDLDGDDGDGLPEGTPVESPTAGNIWQLNVAEGDNVEAGQVVAILESMKMEIEVTAPEAGQVLHIARQEGQQINAGQAIMVLG